MRVGIISPNVILNVNDHNKMYDDPGHPWPLDSLAKKVALLFDKIYLTHDLEVTCRIIESSGNEVDDEAMSGTLRFLADKSLILTPEELGYTTSEEFLKTNIKGAAAKIHAELLRVGNPSNNDYPGDTTLIGQPDIGDFEAHDGYHPRSAKGWNDPKIQIQKKKYESLLLRRNLALLREAGVEECAIVGRLLEGKCADRPTSIVWNVVLKEMPQLDVNASWEDVLDFRREDRTQHLIRSLRRWTKKIVSEKWTPAELEDEVRELIYEYENHLRIARLSAGRGTIEFLITGTAALLEDVVKLRLEKISGLASVIRNRKVELLKEEAKAPGRELALIPEVKRRF